MNPLHLTVHDGQDHRHPAERALIGPPLDVYVANETSPLEPAAVIEAPGLLLFFSRLAARLANVENGVAHVNDLVPTDQLRRGYTVGQAQS